jgi:hypothetical protein
VITRPQQAVQQKSKQRFLKKMRAKIFDFLWLARENSPLPGQKFFWCFFFKKRTAFFHLSA